MPHLSSPPSVTWASTVIIGTGPWHQQRNPPARLHSRHRLQRSNARAKRRPGARRYRNRVRMHNKCRLSRMEPTSRCLGANHPHTLVGRFQPPGGGGTVPPESVRRGSVVVCRTILRYATSRQQSLLPLPSDRRATAQPAPLARVDHVALSGGGSYSRCRKRWWAEQCSLKFLGSALPPSAKGTMWSSSSRKRDPQRRPLCGST